MSKKWAIGIAAVVIVGGIGLALFQPWQLFIDTEVNEDLPVATGPATSAPPPTTVSGGEPAPTTTVPPAPAGPVTLASGSFTSIEHPTTGQALVVDLQDGQRFLRFEGLETDNGPDLLVYLSKAPADGPADQLDTDVVDLGPLKGNIGNQNYAIPADVDLTEYRSAVIWCQRFSVGFGVAPLDPA